MRLPLAAVAAALTLLSPIAAQAGVIYSGSGVIAEFDSVNIDYISGYLAGHGHVSFQFTADAPIAGGFLLRDYIGLDQDWYCYAPECTSDGVHWTGWADVGSGELFLSDTLPAPVGARSFILADYFGPPATPTTPPVGTYPYLSETGFSWQSWNTGYEAYLNFAPGSEGKAFSFVISTVPEPTVWSMLIAGLGLIGSRLRRRRAQSQLLPA